MAGARLMPAAVDKRRKFIADEPGDRVDGGGSKCAVEQYGHRRQHEYYSWQVHRVSGGGNQYGSREYYGDQRVRRGTAQYQT